MSEDAQQVTRKKLSPEFQNAFVKSLQGKEFVLYGGLITLAHAQGFKGIKTSMVQAPNKNNDSTAIVHATVTDANGIEWEGIGDASPINVKPHMVPNIIRMAETRAKGRALRDALGIDLVCYEELSAFEEEKGITQEQVNRLFVLMKSLNLDKDWTKNKVQELTGKTTSADLTQTEANFVIRYLEAYAKFEVKGELEPLQ